MTGSIDTTSFLVIVVVAALAALIVVLLAPKIAIPVVVVELILGIIVGPEVLDFAQVDDFIQFFANLGLGMLFFFAGYEIDFERIRGKPLKLGVWAWILSLGLAYGIGGLLAAAGIVVSLLYTGSALATTAIGTLIPVLRDGGELRTRFGTYLLAGGAMGEFGPILLLTLVLSTDSPVKGAGILLAFIALAVVTSIFAVRAVFRGWGALERTLESSGQLAVRLAVVLIFGLVALASNLGLELLLGGFVAGIITRLALQGHEVARFESKLTAIGYGFLIPFFFVISGMKFDIDSLVGSTAGMLKLPLFLALMLVIRGVPAMVLYRGVLDHRDRAALAFFSSTQLPLVVAITTIALEDDRMRSSTAAALVGAAILSTLIYPLVGLRLRRGRAAGDIDTVVEQEFEDEGYAPVPRLADA